LKKQFCAGTLLFSRKARINLQNDWLCRNNRIFKLISGGTSYEPSFKQLHTFPPHLSAA
jgi:hypothetical protein